MSKAVKKKLESEGKVAVVEEVADNIYSIKFILQSLGYEVRSYSCRENYLDDLTLFQPSIVIVDMMIPNRGGYQVIHSIRSGRLAKLPVLAITADAMEGETGDVLAVGGTDTLAKPYTVGDLQQKLNQWM